ncbi:MAG: hypothetical protein IT427_17725, partial [Pirellulales bacterium]|nr:hypothetical protein [Pirellulales bacterium]
QEHYGYTPYGQATVYNSSYGSPTGTSAIKQKHLYTGRQLDPETLLYYYRARYYHPTLGRFIGRDPSGYYSGDPNLYRYVLDNPINGVDPSRLFGGPLPGPDSPLWPHNQPPKSKPAPPPTSLANKMRPY